MFTRMVTKTLTITQEAYDALKTLKRADESFSKTIIRVTKNKKGLPEEYFGALKNTNIKEKIRENRLRTNKEVEERTKQLRRRL